ncbi:MAG: hypothetical protein CSA58_05980 [Micrococcales bacterium]|nr:MAG: hypothetical protein CSA58_05980 [Micrococcales bacterium]
MFGLASVLTLSGCGLFGGDGSDKSETDASPSASFVDKSFTLNRELNISKRHPNGTVLEITALNVKGRVINVDAEFFNSGGESIEIQLDGSEALRLKDNVGGFYRLVPPEDVSGNLIEIAQGESVGGTWSFLGPLASGATSLTFSVNMLGDESDPDQFDSAVQPEFYIDMPLQ